MSSKIRSVVDLSFGFRLGLKRFQRSEDTDQETESDAKVQLGIDLLKSLEKRPVGQSWNQIRVVGNPFRGESHVWAIFCLNDAERFDVGHSQDPSLELGREGFDGFGPGVHTVEHVVVLQSTGNCGDEDQFLFVSGRNCLCPVWPAQI